MSSKNRNKSIDLFKGILIVLMIISHILQLLFFYDDESMFNDLVNLITFSGFMFSFGYVTYFAYISKDIEDVIFRNKIIKRFLITMLAFYISSISYKYFVENYLSIEEIIKIVSLEKICGYSEFLLSFAFMYILIYLLKDILSKMNDRMFIFFIILSLLMTGINYNLVDNNVIGTIIGTYKFCCFPIIQYFCYYVLGLYVAKKNILFNLKMFILSFFATISSIIYVIINGELPKRFPPSIYFILGGFLFVYLLYLLCNKIKENIIINYIQKIGRNTLSYLVISNIIIFYFKRLMLNHSIFFDKTWEYFFITSFIFMICIILSYLYNSIFLNIKMMINNCKKNKSML